MDMDTARAIPRRHAHMATPLLVLAVLLLGGAGTLQALAVLTGGPFALVALIALAGFVRGARRDDGDRRVDLRRVEVGGVDDERPAPSVVLDRRVVGNRLADRFGVGLVDTGDERAARRLDGRRGQPRDLGRGLARREDRLGHAASGLARGVEPPRVARRVARDLGLCLGWGDVARGDAVEEVAEVGRVVRH